MPRRKILFVSPSLKGGGAERVLLWLAEQCAKAGYDVRVLTIASDKNDAYRVSPQLERSSLNLESSSAGFFSGLLNNTRRIIGVRRLLKSTRPDLVVSFQTTANITALCAVSSISKDRRPPVIISERNYSEFIKLSTLWRYLRKMFYPKADDIVVLSEKNKTWLRTNGINSSAKVIYNPVVYPVPSVKPFICPQSVGQSNNRMLLAVGRLVDNKDHTTLIRAFANVSEDFPDWNLVILGEGDSEKLDMEIASHGLSSRIFLPGRAGNIGDWYLAADIFVLSSRREGFPNVLVEAMASGLPVVACDCPTGPSEIVADGKSGFLVPVGDAESFAEKLKLLMQDEQKMLRFASHGVMVKDSYAPEKIFAQWLVVIQQHFREL